MISYELERRRALNPSYSLRALARDLGVTAPQLSSVLSGKKGISPTSAKLMASALNLTSDEMDFFVQSATALHARDKKVRLSAQRSVNVMLRQKKFSSFSEPKFSVLNEWYYLAILQVFELQGFEPSLEFFSNKLGLPTAAIDQALQELRSAGFLKVTKNFYSPVNRFLKTADVPSRKIRSHLQRMMKMASDALETQSIDERDFSSAVFSVDPARMNEFKKWIAEFREKFCQKGSERGRLTEIYALSIQFFRVSKPLPKEKA